MAAQKLSAVIESVNSKLVENADGDRRRNAMSPS
jgi:hypothetical protein